MKLKVLLIGELPPPFGGVTIHMKRFTAFLKDNKVNFTIFDHYRDSWFSIFAKLRRCSLIHVHSNNYWFLFLLSMGNLLLINKPIILTIHNSRFSSPHSKMFNITKLVVRLILSNVSAVIEVNRNSNLMFYLKIKTVFIPAFIPPSSVETNTEQLPKIFHSLREKHKILITANAYQFSFFNNEDLYGIDLSIELMRMLVTNGHKEIGFIFVIPEVGNKVYMEDIQKLVIKHNLLEYFHLYNKPVLYPAVLNICDIFIRPTNTDGDALSVREALLLKKPVIASDVSIRPTGTILFKNRNVNDLFLKLKQLIENDSIKAREIEGIKFDDYASKIIDVYNKVTTPIIH